MEVEAALKAPENKCWKRLSDVVVIRQLLDLLGNSKNEMELRKNILESMHTLFSLHDAKVNGE